MKKKILLGVIAGVLTLTLGTATAFAASENFTDQNSDGVCDNFQSTTRPLNGQAIKKGNVTARKTVPATGTATNTVRNKKELL